MFIVTMRDHELVSKKKARTVQNSLARVLLGIQQSRPTTIFQYFFGYSDVRSSNSKVKLPLLHISGSFRISYSIFIVWAPSLLITPRSGTDFGWNQASGGNMVLCEAYPHLNTLSSNLRHRENKTTRLRIMSAELE